MATEKIFFLRSAGDIQVLQSLTWGYVDDTSVEERDQLLKKLTEGKYTTMAMFVPIDILQPDKSTSDLGEGGMRDETIRISPKTPR